MRFLDYKVKNVISPKDLITLKPYNLKLICLL